MPFHTIRSYFGTLASRRIAPSGLTAAALTLAALLAGPASAATCGTDASGFSAWLQEYKQEATSQGISQSVVNSALSGVSYDRRTIQLDHSQHVFKQSFEQFSGRMIPPRLPRAKAMLAKNAALFDKIEARFGVPREVVVTLWALETDFGAVSQNNAILTSLATLAYDCRRSEFFTNELTAALAIVQRGDLTPAQMRGGWAGELGQTQFLPSSYVKYGVDFDGNGRADLLHSPADVLASTANYLHGYGWQNGQPWGEGTANFAVLQQWNKSMVYCKTVAEMARRLAEG